MFIARNRFSFKAILPVMIILALAFSTASAAKERPKGKTPRAKPPAKSVRTSRPDPRGERTAKSARGRPGGPAAAKPAGRPRKLSESNHNLSHRPFRRKPRITEHDRHLSEPFRPPSPGSGVFRAPKSDIVSTGPKSFRSRRDVVDRVSPSLPSRPAPRPLPKRDTQHSTPDGASVGTIPAKPSNPRVSSIKPRRGEPHGGQALGARLRMNRRSLGPTERSIGAEAGRSASEKAIFRPQKGRQGLLVQKGSSRKTRSFKHRFSPATKDINIVNNGSLTLVAETDRSTQLRRPLLIKKAVYEDRIFSRGRSRPRHFHVYRDRRNRLCHRVIRPRFHLGLCYNFGRRIAFKRFYPYYQRRYVFVSIGGYWPYHYTYRRYYWYPCHLYYWHGYHPVARLIPHDNYNYYVYNYYGYGTEGYDSSGSLEPVDHTTFEDIRRKIEADKGPAPETLSDIYFDQAVKAFEKGDYKLAAEKLARAMRESPEDTILPFALAQALMADEKYEDAVLVLRAAIANMPEDEPGVFFPRGLYKDENILFEQIERLGQRAEAAPADFDLQFLLGYQLLGAGNAEEAVDPLRKAAADPQNKAAATVLLELAQDLLAADTEAGDTEGAVQ